MLRSSATGLEGSPPAIASHIFLDKRGKLSYTTSLVH